MVEGAGSWDISALRGDADTDGFEIAVSSARSRVVDGVTRNLMIPEVEEE